MIDYRRIETFFVVSFEVETAMAETTMLTETDVGMATCKVVTTTLVEEMKGLFLETSIILNQSNSHSYCSLFCCSLSVRKVHTHMVICSNDSQQKYNTLNEYCIHADKR